MLRKSTGKMIATDTGTKGAITLTPSGFRQIAKLAAEWAKTAERIADGMEKKGIAELQVAHFGMSTRGTEAMAKMLGLAEVEVNANMDVSIRDLILQANRP